MGGVCKVIQVMGVVCKVLQVIGVVCKVIMVMGPVCKLTGERSFEQLDAGNGMRVQVDTGDCSCV